MIDTKKDGRVILTGGHYTAFREQVWLRDHGHCVRCGRHVNLTIWENDSDMHVHHKHGRGMGGSKRNDTLEECESLCAKCHRKEHNQ